MRLWENFDRPIVFGMLNDPRKHLVRLLEESCYIYQSLILVCSKFVSERHQEVTYVTPAYIQSASEIRKS